jgi:hypothetical protein
MDNKKILLVNLSKGRTGELNSKLLGMMFVMKFQAAAMSRSNIPEDDRVDFSLYVDEFQNFSTDSFATIMSEARKYHLNLIVANQFTTQLTPEIRDAVFGNMGTIISFRVGQNDVDSLGKYFQPTFDVDDLLRVPNYNTIVRTLIGGVPTQPFSMATLPGLGTPNPHLADALKQLSAAKFGRPKAEVEHDIFERITTKEDPKPSSLGASGAGTFDRPASLAPSGAAAWPGSSAAKPANRSYAQPNVASTPAPKAKPASFLDDWLTKRRQGMPSPSVGSYPRATPAPSQSALPPVQPSVIQSAPSAVSPVAPLPQPVAPIQLADKVETQNISSDVIEHKEVDKIAAELKEQLKTAKPTVEAVAPAETAPTPPAPAPVIEAPKPKTEHVINLQSVEDDTIYIDRDGSLHQQAEHAKDVSPVA